MKIPAVKCNNCRDTIYSRAGHDFHWCSCESVAVDGGYEPGYERLLGYPEDYTHTEVEVNATKKELYDDWNSIKNKYGVIKDAAK